MRLVIAECQVDYAGRLSAHLSKAKRLLILKADGSISVHADDRAYKPLNWMNPPCILAVRMPDEEETKRGWHQIWEVRAANGDSLQICLGEVFLDTSHTFGSDPGLIKDGVEAHLQVLLAENPETFGDGYKLVRREYFTPIGPVDLLLRDYDGKHIAVEIKRRGEIDGVEQLTRYLELMNLDPQIAPVRGIFAAQQIKPQARTLATERGIECLVIDYDALRGIDHSDERLF